MKQSLQKLGYQVKKKLFGPYTYQLSDGTTTYHIYLLPTNHSHLVTINSKYIWNIKSGRIEGARFIERTKRVIQLQAFLQLPNPIIVFKGAPYKVLKYINESEVVDITTSLAAHNLTILPTKESIVPYIKQQESKRD